MKLFKILFISSFLQITNCLDLQDNHNYKNVLGIKSDKIILLFFKTKHCGFSKKLEKEVLSHDKVKTLLSKFTFKVIDVDKEKELAQSFRIDSYPSFIFLDKDCNEFDRQRNPLNVDQLIFKFSKNLVVNKMSLLNDRALKDSSLYNKNIKQIKKHLYRGDFKSSYNYIKKLRKFFYSDLSKVKEL